MPSHISRRRWVNVMFPNLLPYASNRCQVLSTGLLLFGVGLPCSMFSGCGTLGSKSPLLKPAATAHQVASVISATDEERARTASSSSGDSTGLGKPTNASDSRAAGQVAGVSYERPIVESQAGAIHPVETVATGAGHAFRLYQPQVSFQGADGGTDAGACSGCGTQCGGSATVCFATPEPLQKNSNEYIFDGGDQHPAVVVKKDWTAAGVDPTDTVIYYETLGGQVCVKPSNRVPIYAPRFAAVRQVTGLNLAARAVGTERMFLPVAPVGIDESNLAGNVSAPVAPQGEQQVGMLDAFQENRLGVPIAQVIPPLRLSETLVMFENITFFTTGEMIDDEIPVLGLVLANAREWYNPESVEVLIDGQQAALVVDTKRAQDVHVYEMPDKCAMRICKAASHTIANSGDIVRFTIRFDNVGPKPLGNAVVMDSLSARLEYIEGSQQCSVEAQFTADANEVGSQVLRWEIEEAISPSEGGVISFDCRVR